MDFSAPKTGKINVIANKLLILRYFIIAAPKRLRHGAFKWNFPQLEEIRGAKQQVNSEGSEVDTYNGDSRGMQRICIREGTKWDLGMDSGPIGRNGA